MNMRPDPTFHASPKLAMEAPPENFAYTLLLSPDFSKPDALAVVDVKPGSPTYAQGRPHGDDAEQGRRVPSLRLERLLVGAVAADWPRLPRAALPDHSRACARRASTSSTPSRDPTQAKIHKIIEPEEVFRKTGYSRPHTIHCGPEGIYVSTLGGGGKDGTDGPPGIFIMDCQTFEILGRWEIDRGPQKQALRFLVEPAARLHGVQRMGAAAAVRERHRPRGPARQQVRPSHPLLGPARSAATCRPSTSAPTTRWRSRCVPPTTRCANTASSASSSTRPISKARSGPGGARAANSTSRRRRPSRPSRRTRTSCRRCCKGFGAVPPLVTDIDLSLDDRFLYVACWGTGEMRQYDVSEPEEAQAGGLGAHRRHRAAHAAPQRQALWRRPADGRDQPRRQARVLDQLALFDLGRPVLSRTACRAPRSMANAGPNGGLELAKDYWVNFPDGYRAHQIRLEGGDCSTDSFCYPSV